MLEELLSLIRSGDAGWRETGAKLKKTASEEHFGLEDLFNQFKETESVAGAKDISRKRRKSKFRLGGSLLGALALTALTGGTAAPLALRAAAGAGLGSLAGSKYSMATQPGGWRLAQSKAQTPTGMFFKGTRGKADLERSEVNRMLSEANKTFAMAQYGDAVQDAWSAYKIASLPKTAKSLWDFGKGKGQIVPDVWDLDPVNEMDNIDPSWIEELEV